MTCNNISLRKAAKAKNDEFYTRYEDVAAEVENYKDYLKDKIIYLPCDSEKSNFWKYFVDNFDALGIKRVVATHYNPNGSYKLSYEGAEVRQEVLQMDGDFRSEECVEFLDECDIVITNPPFSLFKEFIDLIMAHGREFLVIGNVNAYSYKNIFPLMKDNKMRSGYNQPKLFILEDGTISKKLGGLCRWLTTLPVNKEDKIKLVKSYNPKDYPKYDNFDAIEVGRVANIPKDYYGMMGVPITFLDKYNPNLFEIIDINPHFMSIAQHPKQLSVNNKDVYARVIIKRIETT